MTFCVHGQVIDLQKLAGGCKVKMVPQPISPSNVQFVEPPALAEPNSNPPGPNTIRARGLAPSAPPVNLCSTLSV